MLQKWCVTSILFEVCEVKKELPDESTLVCCHFQTIDYHNCYCDINDDINKC